MERPVDCDIWVFGSLYRLQVFIEFCGWWSNIIPAHEYVANKIIIIVWSKGKHGPHAWETCA